MPIPLLMAVGWLVNQIAQNEEQNKIADYNESVMQAEKKKSDQAKKNELREADLRKAAAMARAINANYNPVEEDRVDNVKMPRQPNLSSSRTWQGIGSAVGQYGASYDRNK